MLKRSTAKTQTIYRSPDHRFTGRIDRRMITNFDWPLLVIIGLFIVIGLINLYSATSHDDAHNERFVLQLIWIFVGLVLMVLSLSVNYQIYKNAAYGVMIGTIVLLLATLIIGYVSHGAKRWLLLGPVRFQPSELAKLAVVLTLAKYFSENAKPFGMRLKDLQWPLALIGGPTLLILMQPDLGTALMILLIATTMILFVGVRRRTLIGLSVTGLLILPMMYFFVLQDYQRNRILTLLNPDRDPTGTGWHIRQSLIAIGSGQIFGKGWMHGTQTKLDFLPEQHTDFIFSVLAEEWGFIGGLLTLALFFILILLCLNIAMNSKDQFGTLLGVGLTAFIFWHVVVNIGMVLGLLPVVGVPLPFMSYGRTSLLTMMIAIGMLQNIASRRYIF
ncbi:MAG: rod shape-determining protein RodA [Myxococcales bacterium]|nr:rod shape-determining protein RodA [Myxococcales bacterium]